MVRHLDNIFLTPLGFLSEEFVCVSYASGGRVTVPRLIGLVANVWTRLLSVKTSISSRVDIINLPINKSYYSNIPSKITS